MKKNLSCTLTILFLCMILAVPVSLAQENVESDEAMEEAPILPDSEELKNTREEVRSEIKEQRNQLKTNLKEKREEAKEQFAADRKAFQTDLKALRDEQKQQIVEQVDTRLQDLNTMKTDLLMQHLDRIATIVAQIEEKAGDRAGDTALVEEALTDAQDAIASAEAAIAKQAGTAYIIEIGVENQLRTAVKEVVQQFKEDMQNTIMAVRNAHKAAIAAARALAGVQKPIDTMERTGETEATDSAETE